jgi:YD repeat-containing protein
MEGTLARTGLSPTLKAATYGTANRLTLRDGANFSHDENGNVTSDGTITYNWNARNQLTSMSGPGLTASFQYDPSGRRVNKTINGISASYLYDGLNAVQELSGTTPTANQLVGGTDRVLTRTDAVAHEHRWSTGKGRRLLSRTMPGLCRLNTLTMHSETQLRAGLQAQTVRSLQAEMMTAPGFTTTERATILHLCSDSLAKIRQV